MGRVPARLSARIDVDLKAKLEQQDADAGVPFNKWLSANLNGLVKKNPG